MRARMQVEVGAHVGACEAPLVHTLVHVRLRFNAFAGSYSAHSYPDIPKLMSSCFQQYDI